MFTAKYTAPLSKKYPLKIVLSQPAWMIQALARERRPRGKSPAQHGAVAAAPFFFDVSAPIAEWRPAEICQIQKCAMAPLAVSNRVQCIALNRTATANETNHRKTATQVSRSCVKVHCGIAVSGKCRGKNRR
jgi:hypothetical protein